jgi:hypothetical protein
MSFASRLSLVCVLLPSSLGTRICVEVAEWGVRLAAAQATGPEKAITAELTSALPAMQGPTAAPPPEDTGVKCPALPACLPACLAVHEGVAHVPGILGMEAALPKLQAFSLG